MGNKQSQPQANITKIHFNPETEVLGKTFDEHYGDIKIVRDVKSNDKMILKEVVLNTKQTFEAEENYFNARVNVRHPNVVKVIGYNSQDKHNFCSTYYKFALFIEHHDENLQQILDHHRESKTPFTESEILLIADDLITGLSYFQSQGVSHGDIRPFNIFHKDQVYKLSDPSLNAQKNSNALNLAIVHKTKTYLSPELIPQVPQQKFEITSDKYRSDVYSLGVTLLSLSTLTNAEDLYNYEQGTINHELVRERLDNVKQNYSEFTHDLIEHMLVPHESERPDSVVLSNKVSPHKDYMRRGFTGQPYVDSRTNLDPRTHQAPKATAGHGEERVKRAQLPSDDVSGTRTGTIEELEARIRAAIQRTEETFRIVKVTPGLSGVFGTADPNKLPETHNAPVNTTVTGTHAQPTATVDPYIHTHTQPTGTVDPYSHSHTQPTANVDPYSHTHAQPTSTYTHTYTGGHEERAKRAQVLPPEEDTVPSSYTRTGTGAGAGTVDPYAHTQVQAGTTDPYAHTSVQAGTTDPYAHTQTQAQPTSDVQAGNYTTYSYTSNAGAYGTAEPVAEKDHSTIVTPRDPERLAKSQVAQDYTAFNYTSTPATAYEYTYTTTTVTGTAGQGQTGVAAGEEQALKSSIPAKAEDLYDEITTRALLRASQNLRASQQMAASGTGGTIVNPGEYTSSVYVPASTYAYETYKSSTPYNNEPTGTTNVTTSYYEQPVVTTTYITTTTTTTTNTGADGQPVTTTTYDQRRTDAAGDVYNSGTYYGIQTGAVDGSNLEGLINKVLDVAANKEGSFSDHVQHVQQSTA